MSPENQTATTNEQEKTPAQLHAEAAQRIVSDKAHFNEKQLMHRVNDELLGSAIDQAIASNYEGITVIDAQGTGETHEAPGIELISHLQVVETSRLQGNENWKRLLPKEAHLADALSTLTQDPYLARIYNNALKHRFDELMVQKQRHEAESAVVSPETERIVEIVEDMGEEAVAAAELDATPLRRKTFIQGDFAESRFAPGKVQSAEIVASNQLSVGQEFTVPMPVHNSQTGEVIPGKLRDVKFEVKALKTVEGKFVASIMSDDLVFETFIPSDAPVIDAEYKKILSGILEEQHGAIAFEDVAEPEAAARESAPMAPETASVETDFAAIDSKVFIKNEAGAYQEGRLVGFYNAGDTQPSRNAAGKQFAVFEGSDGQAIGVHIAEMDRKLQADRLKEMIFPAPAAPKTTSVEAVTPAIAQESAPISAKAAAGELSFGDGPKLSQEEYLGKMTDGLSEADKRALYDFAVAEAAEQRTRSLGEHENAGKWKRDKDAALNAMSGEARGISRRYANALFNYS